MFNNTAAVPRQVLSLQQSEVRDVNHSTEGGRLARAEDKVKAMQTELIVLGAVMINNPMRNPISPREPRS